MTGKRILQPGPDHPITVTPSPDRITVQAAGRTVADSSRALILKEASYPAVRYIPREDVDMTLLRPSDHATYCPYKGDCTYFSIPSAGERGTDAVWSYPEPYAAVAAIKDHLAFYPDRVEQKVEAPAG